MTTPESHARIRRWFDELIDLPPADRVRRAREVDLDPTERAQLIALLTTSESKHLTGLHGLDVGRALDEAELKVLCQAPPPGFELADVIGRGGMGVVFRARQIDPPRDVALKMLSLREGGEEAALRAGREAAVLARMQHPCVAQVIAAGSLAQADGLVRPWYALELVEGARGIVAHADQLELSPASRLQLMLDTCAAVQHGHEKGVLHGDIKSANVLVDGEGRVKVIDFGVARLLGAENRGPVGGTPRYMAPELLGSPGLADVRSDVYALGALLGELVGFARDRELGWVVAKAMAADPGERYASVAILREDLARWLDRRPLAAGPATLGYPLSKFARRNARALLVLIVTVALAGIGGVNSMRVHAAERKAGAESVRASEEAERAFWLLRDATLGLSAPFEQGRSPEARARVLLGRLAQAGPAEGAPRSHGSDRQMLVGFGYHALGDLEAARTALRGAVEGYAELGVPQDPRLYFACSRLAEVELQRGAFGDAEDAARRGLAAMSSTTWPARERALPGTLLATALLHQGRAAEAERVADDLLARGAPTDPGVIALRLARSWALAEQASGGDVKARVAELMEEARERPEIRIQDELVRYELGAAALESAGDLGPARDLLEQALQRARDQLGEESPMRLRLEAELERLGGPAPLPDDADRERAREDVELALSGFAPRMRTPGGAGLAPVEPELAQLAEEARARLGPEDHLTAGVLLVWARALMAVHRNDEALELLAELRSAVEHPLGLDYFSTGIYERIYAVALLDAGRPEEAVPLAEEALRKMGLNFRDGARPMQVTRQVLERARAEAGR